VLVADGAGSEGSRPRSSWGRSPRHYRSGTAPVEGCVHAQVPALGDPLSQLDNHSIVQRGLLLLGEHLTAAKTGLGRIPIVATSASA
jgi:hypothetical protein